MVPTKELQPFRTSTRGITRHKINPPATHLALSPRSPSFSSRRSASYGFGDYNVLPARAATFAGGSLLSTDVPPQSGTNPSQGRRTRQSLRVPAIIEVKDSRAWRIRRLRGSKPTRFGNDRIFYFPALIINPLNLTKNTLQHSHIHDGVFF